MCQHISMVQIPTSFKPKLTPIYKQSLRSSLAMDLCIAHGHTYMSMGLAVQSLLQVKDQRCFLLFWSFCLELTASSHYKS